MTDLHSLAGLSRTWRARSARTGLLVWVSTVAGAAVMAPPAVPLQRDAVARFATAQRPLAPGAVTSVADAPLVPSLAADRWHELPTQELPHHVVTLDGASFVLIETDAHAAADFSSAPRKLDGPDAFWVGRALPAVQPGMHLETGMHLGQWVMLYTEQGTCVAQLGATQAVRAVDNEDPDPSAEELWRSAAGDGLSFWAVAVDTSGCAQAPRWASTPLAQRPHDRLPVRQGMPDADLEAKVTTALRELPEASQAEAAYAEEYKREGEAWDTDAEVKVQVFQVGLETYALGNLLVDGACGEWYTAMAGLWRVEHKGARPVLRLVYSTDRMYDIATAVSIDAATAATDEPPTHGRPLVFVERQALTIPALGGSDEGCGC